MGHGVYLGLGSNLGDKENNLSESVRQIKKDEDIKVNKMSSFYLTQPVGGPDQDEFLNGVIEIKTRIEPSDLLDFLKKIEKKMGRKQAPRNYPRIIDIDILLYDDKIINVGSGIVPDLKIPHPRMHERIFVLKGMMELAPDLVHPVLGKTMRELLTSRELSDPHGG